MLWVSVNKSLAWHIRLWCKILRFSSSLWWLNRVNLKNLTPWRSQFWTKRRLSRCLRPRKRFSLPCWKRCKLKVVQRAEMNNPKWLNWWWTRTRWSTKFTSKQGSKMKTSNNLWPFMCAQTPKSRVLSCNKCKKCRVKWACRVLEAWCDTNLIQLKRERINFIQISRSIFNSIILKTLIKLKWHSFFRV